MPSPYNPVAGGIVGTAVCGPACGAIVAVTSLVVLGVTLYMNRPPPDDAKDPDGAKAPGKPGPAEGFSDPKAGEEWAKNPNGSGYGWADDRGDVWVPTGQDGAAHGGPHWDVQKKGGGYDNVYPGGTVRPGQ